MIIIVAALLIIFFQIIHIYHLSLSNVWQAHQRSNAAIIAWQEMYMSQKQKQPCLEGIAPGFWASNHHQWVSGISLFKQQRSLYETAYIVEQSICSLPK